MLYSETRWRWVVTSRLSLCQNRNYFTIFCRCMWSLHGNIENWTLKTNRFLCLILCFRRTWLKDTKCIVLYRQISENAFSDSLVVLILVTWNKEDKKRARHEWRRCWEGIGKVIVTSDTGSLAFKMFFNDQCITGWSFILLMICNTHT